MPLAIRYGVPESVFWGLNPRTLEPWQRMYELQQQIEADERDYNAWLNGMYVLSAISSAFSKENQYPSEPYSVTQRREEQAEANRIAADKFMAFAMAFNERFKAQNESGTKGGETDAKHDSN